MEMVIKLLPNYIKIFFSSDIQTITGKIISPELRSRIDFDLHNSYLT
jgi:hypothetical protein